MSVYDFTVTDNKGNVVNRFAPTNKPNTLEEAIEAELAK